MRDIKSKPELEGKTIEEIYSAECVPRFMEFHRVGFMSQVPPDLVTSGAFNICGHSVSKTTVFIGLVGITAAVGYFVYKRRHR